MQEGDLSSDRRRAQEDEYFRRRDQELVERQQRRTEAEAERRVIAEVIGVDEEVVLQDLQMAGYKADTIVLLKLAPPTQVAWTDGSVSKRERELLLRIATREHVAEGSPAHIQLDMWLDRRPSDYLFGASIRAIRDILMSLQPEVRVSLRRKLIDDCTTIGTAASGLFGWGRHVPHEEQQLIERTVRELS